VSVPARLFYKRISNFNAVPHFSWLYFIPRSRYSVTGCGITSVLQAVRVAGSITEIIMEFLIYLILPGVQWLLGWLRL
jgi:hypothetical protein